MSISSLISPELTWESSGFSSEISVWLPPDSDDIDDGAAPSVVYVDKKIYTEPNAVVQATAPVTIVPANSPLSTPTAIPIP